MHRFLALLVYILLTNPIQAQNSFSFNCVRDTTVSCDVQCITLKVSIPNIFSSSNSYSVNKFSNGNCFRGYVSPESPGPSVNLTIDDRYSPIINLPFNFSFYGNTYNQLTASTNGFLTFDISKATTFSHYGILASGTLLSSTTGTPLNLPSNLYDGAIIMGPYHDLDPNNGSTTQQIKYNVVGNAPYRKWILSYYDVPLYTTACLNLALNTHQIVLYETLGIVEVFIYNKEICPNWNDGRSMIGMQNMNGTSGIMAPGRQATSPAWGSQGMIESWRFVPSAGASLFDRVELYTLSGTFVAKGITTTAANNLIDVNFNNVCPPPAGDVYIIKSYYKNPSGDGEIIGTDTVNVYKGETIVAEIKPAGCASGTKGEITITAPLGNGYEFTMDGSVWQSYNVFVATSGVHTIKARITGSNCISSKTFTVPNAPLTGSVNTTPTQCTGPPTGTITVTPGNGTAPYLYSIDGVNFQSSNSFTGIAAGEYKGYLKDASGCIYTGLAIVNKQGPSFTTDIVKPICGGSNTGSITVNASGNPPYVYSLNTGPFQTSNVFNNITTGNHTVFVNDAGGCISAMGIVVTSDITINANATSKMTTCFEGKDGSITINPSDGTAPYQIAIQNGIYQNSNQFNNLDSGEYRIQVKDAKGCIKDTIVAVLEPNIFLITAITTKATSCASPDGEITIKANGGTTPYIYSIDNGKTFSVDNSFTVKSGSYSLVVKDFKGCLSYGSAVVEAKDNDMKLELGQNQTICADDSITLLPATSPPADYFRWSIANGLSDTTSGTPKVSPTDTVTYKLIARTGFCEKQDSITINVLRKPIANAGTDTTICYNTAANLKGAATNMSGPVKYLWWPSTDVSNPTSANTTVLPKNTRTNKYLLQVSDNYGCNFKVYDDVIVTMLPQVVAFAGNDTVATSGIPFQLNGSGGTTYAWTPSHVLSNPYISNPIAMLNSDTKFNLQVKNDYGCIGNHSVTVKVYQGSTYYIPNAFTPNADGLNDLFQPVAPGIKKTNYFRIFNRWGKLMFETKDVKRGWNSQYRGIPQPTGVYVWMIKGVDVNGKPIELKGTVTLIR